MTPSNTAFLGIVFLILIIWNHYRKKCKHLKNQIEELEMKIHGKEPKAQETGQQRGSDKENNKTQLELEFAAHPESFYKLKESCMNKNESRAFFYLNCALDDFFPNPKERENYLIFPQMSLHAIFNILKEVKADEAKDKIASRLFPKNIDFTICQRYKKENYYLYRPLILIEIDGSSHYQPKYGEAALQKQQDSDAFKNNLTYSLGIPLLRYTTTNDNITRDDRDKIKNILFAYLKNINNPESFTIQGY